VSRTKEENRIEIAPEIIDAGVGLIMSYDREADNAEELVRRLLDLVLGRYRPHAIQDKEGEAQEVLAGG